jgi:hypothetical protein
MNTATLMYWLLINTSAVQLLTSGSEKNWTIDLEASSFGCQNVSVVEDNIYSFHADGTFEFNHGLVTEDPNCEDCCGDMKNLIGTWKLSNNERHLKVRISKLKDSDSEEETEGFTLFDADIESLSEDRLVILQENPKTKQRVRFEFRKK